jgi:hypothetical protein
VFRASRNKTQVGFRLTQAEADALAVAAEVANKSPGAYAKEALLERLHGDPHLEVKREVQALHKDALARFHAQAEDLRKLRAELAAFRTEFLQALPET